MNRKLVIGLVVIAAAVGGLVFWLRRRASNGGDDVQPQVQGNTATTTQPQSALASLLANTPLSGLVNTPLGQAAIQTGISYLPPIGLGTDGRISQSTPLPPVTIDPAVAGAKNFLQRVAVFR